MDSGMNKTSISNEKLLLSTKKNQNFWQHFIEDDFCCFTKFTEI